MSDELKPCPFCGGSAIVFGRDGTQRVAICNECNASTDFKETEYEAMDAWNKRIEPTFTPDELDAIKRMFVEHFSRKPNEGTIIEKCANAVKGASVE